MSLGLVFGGCCANALTLQELTGGHADLAYLITFSQFAFISSVSIFSNIKFNSYPTLKRRRIPIAKHLLQVVLFYFVSLLNNAAFAYDIPVTVHIIFRSGGLVTSMLLGWLLTNKKFSRTRIVSVLIVTIGVYLTTTSTSPSKSNQSSHSRQTYNKGIGILAVALFLSSYLGIVQERTIKAHAGNKPYPEDEYAPAHRESLFYLHALALPLFIPLLPGIRDQFRALGSYPPIEHYPELLISSQYLPLAFNSITALICTTGVHGLLSSSYTSLTITLVLAIRKAVSLVLSVLMDGNWNQSMMWAGASLVTFGTVLYALDAGQSAPGPYQEKKTQ